MKKYECVIRICHWNVFLLRFAFIKNCAILENRGIPQVQRYFDFYGMVNGIRYLFSNIAVLAERKAK